MSFSDQQLDSIYYRTSGYCHICGKKLARTNYGNFDAKGNWEVEHSNAQCNGGTDRACNLFAACIRCNREKGVFTTKTARTWHGKTCAPLSAEKRKEAKFENGVLCAVVFGIAARCLLGPIGWVIGGFGGAWFGSSQN